MISVRTALSLRIMRWTSRLGAAGVLASASLAGPRSNSAGIIHTLDGYIAHALKHNPRLGAARATVRAAERERALALSLPDPSISAGYHLSKVETRVGPQRGKIGASQTIPWPGKLLARRRQAAHATERERYTREQIAADVVAAVREVYAELYATGRSITISRDNLVLLRQIESIVLSRYATASAHQAQVLKLQVEAAVLENRVRTLEAQGDKQRARLKALLDAPQDLAIPYPRAIPVLALPDSLPTLENAAFDHNYTLQAKREARREISASVGLARHGYGPDIRLMTDYVIVDKSPTLAAGDAENGKDAWSVGVSATLPLWIGKKNRRIEQAGYRAEAAMHAVKERQNEVRQSVRSLFEDYRDIRRQIELLEGVLSPRAEQALALMREAYINAEATVLEYLDAQRTLLDLRDQLARERARKAITEANLQRILGAAARGATLRMEEQS